MDELVMQIVTMPKDTNPYGKIFGGWIMSQIDLAGAVAARKIASDDIVTVGANDIKFIIPIEVGDIVSLYAKVLKVGTTSISVQVLVYTSAWGDKSEQKILAASAVITYVNVDINGKKTPIRLAN